MAKITRDQLFTPLQPYLQPGETVQAAAVGVKQPNILLIFLLLLLAILPGLIAVFLLTKNYLVALTNRRVIVLRIKGIQNYEVKEMTEYSLDELPALPAKSSTGPLFTHISIKDAARPFVAKFHRAYCPTNREDAMAIGAAISSGSITA